VSGGGGASASGGGKGRAGEVQWGMEKLRLLSVWGGRGRRGELHGDLMFGGANGGRQGSGRARAGPDALL
jgi:hypothetical protein